MAKKKTEEPINWCYIGEKKDHVLMTCSREDWESIIRIIEWAKNRLHQYQLHESDEWNYGYTRRG